MEIKLLALDMDGTVLCDDHETICPENRLAIEAAIAKGVTVVTTTGRVRARVPAQMLKIEGQRYLITSNGAVLSDLIDRSVLYTDLLPSKTFTQILEALEGMGLYLEAYCDGLACVEAGQASMVGHLPVNSGRLAMISRGIRYVDSLREFAAQGENLLEKINIPYLDQEQQREVLARLEKVPGLLLTSSIEKNIEINSESTTKAGALAFLGRHLGISPEEVMAVGDGRNDVEMLQMAGISVAPANAGTLVKQAARYTTHATNNEGAVAEAIKRFIL